MRGVVILVLLTVLGCEDAPKRNVVANVVSASASAGVEVDNPLVHACLVERPSSEDTGFAANHLVGHRDFLWRNGRTLNVHFMDGDKSQHRLVRKFAPQWSKHANLTFRFFDPDKPPVLAHIRITFNKDNCSLGCTNYASVGTSAVYRILSHGHSMCLPCKSAETPEWLWRRTILHEFGHAVGLFHEHQRAGIKWDEKAVYASCKKMGWTRPYCKAHVLIPLDKKWPAHKLTGTPYDPQSIMHYQVDPSWTLDKKAIGGSSELSDLDKKGIAELYPRTKLPTATGRLRLANTVDGKKYKLFIIGDEAAVANVKSVTYILHPSMVPSEADGDATQPGHPYEADADKPFTARAMVNNADGTAELLKHTVNLAGVAAVRTTGIAQCDGMYNQMERCPGIDLRDIMFERRGLTYLAKQSGNKAKLIKFCQDRIDIMAKKCP